MVHFQLGLLVARTQNEDLPEERDREGKVVLASGFDLLLVRLGPDFLEADQVVVARLQVVGQRLDPFTPVGAVHREDKH